MSFIALFRHDGSPADRLASRGIDVEALASSILGEEDAPSSITVLVGEEELPELNLYRDGDDFSPPYDLVLLGDFQDGDSLQRAAGHALAAGRYDRCYAFEVEETRVKTSGREPANGRVPGIHMLHPLFFHDDLPRSALLRSWREIHADLAVRVHIGADAYSQFLVTGSPESGPNYGGFSDFQFPSREALLTGYFESDRGRSEIRHDIRHFIRGLPPRLFATMYTYERP